MTFFHTQTRQGDRGLASFLVSPDNDDNRRIFSRTNRAEVGYHRQFRPGSELMVYFSGRTDDQVIDDPEALRVFRGQVPAALRRSTRNPNISFQGSHLLKVSDFQFKYGFDIFEGRSRSLDILSFCSTGPREEGCAFPGDPPPVIETQEFDYERNKVRFKTVFLQGDYLIGPRLIFTAGLQYDWSGDDNLFVPGQKALHSWNPQAGVLITPLENTTFRFAFARSLQTHSQERLVPTHLYGFVVSPNEFELSRTTGYHFGWDQRWFSGRTFIRTSAFWKDRELPIAQGSNPVEFDGDFYGGGFVLNQFLTDQWTLVTDYRITRDLNFFGQRHDHDLRLGFFFVHPDGYSFGAEEEYLNQSRIFGVADSTEIWTTNVALSYELPEKMGLMALRIRNIFNREYVYLSDPLALEARVPRRELSFQLNFFF